MRAIVLLSGGQDSTTCLYAAIKRWGKEEVTPISIVYGQRHATEVESARRVADMAGMADRHEIIRLPNEILKSTSPLVNYNIQVAQYESADKLPGGLEATFIPLRNLLFITIAANRAVSLGALWIVIGVSEEDYGGYPDCRSKFLGSVSTTIAEALDRKGPGVGIAIWAPLVNLTKAKTVLMAKDLPGCWDALAYSHTCYNGVVPPCGKCHACLLRSKGFSEAGFLDPLIERLGV